MGKEKIKTLRQKILSNAEYKKLKGASKIQKASIELYNSSQWKTFIEKVEAERKTP